MPAPVTSTKRILTEDVHDALHASRSPYANIVPDDVTARLQSLGSRVRKSVNEGYATHRFGGMSSVTPTPFSTPAKPVAGSTPSRGPEIFRSANDTLLDVFSSPAHAKKIAHSPSTPRRKRRHAEADLQDDGELVAPEAASKEQQGRSLATETTGLSDDEDVTIITDGSPNRPNKPIKPLKLSAYVEQSSHPHMLSNTNSKSCAITPDADMRHGNTIRAERKEMFNQPF